MTAQKSFIKVAIAMVLVGLLVSPALAHRKSRFVPRHPSGFPRWVPVRHSHEATETPESVTQNQSEAKKFDLLGGAFDVVAGAWKAIGNTVEDIFKGGRKASDEVGKIDSTSSSRREYRFVPKHPSSVPRWIRKH